MKPSFSRWLIISAGLGLMTFATPKSSFTEIAIG
jgi:hypothetical protein